MSHALEPIPTIARYASIDDARKRYGLSRARMYNLIRQHPHIAKRLWGTSMVDLYSADAVFDALPTTAEAPSVRAGQLVNLSDSKLSKKVIAARARKAKAANEAAKATTA